MARKNKLVDFLKWSAAIAGGAAIGAVTVHYVHKGLEARAAKAEGGEDLELEPEPELAAAQGNPGGMMVAGMPMLPVTPMLPAMLMPSMMPSASAQYEGTNPMGPSPMLQSLRDQAVARDAQRAREKVARERELEAIQKRFMEDD